MIINEIKLHELKDALDMEQHRLLFIDKHKQYERAKKELETARSKMEAQARYLDARRHGTTKRFFNQISHDVKKLIMRYARC